MSDKRRHSEYSHRRELEAAGWKSTNRLFYPTQEHNNRMVECELDHCKAVFDTAKSAKIHHTKSHKNTPDELDDPEYLESEYNSGKSMKEISQTLGVSRTSVQNRFEWFSIESRNAWDHQHGNTKFTNELESEIVNRYQSGSSTVELGNIYDCSHQTISNILERHGLSTRSISDSQKMPTMAEEKEIIERYDTETTMKEIAEDLGYSLTVVLNTLKRYGIEREYDYSGENNGNWKGGCIEYNYGPNWQEKRKERLEKDGYECAICGIDQSTHKDEYGSGLSVHHITPRRDFIEDGEYDYESGNRLDNLISLCISCHQRWEGIPVVPQ